MKNMIDDILASKQYVGAYVANNGMGKREMVLYYIIEDKIKCLHFEECTPLYDIVPDEIEISNIRFVDEDEYNFNDLLNRYKLFNKFEKECKGYKIYENVINNFVDKYAILNRFIEKYGADNMSNDFFYLLNEIEKIIERLQEKGRKLKENETKEIEEMLKLGVPRYKTLKSKNKFEDEIEVEAIWIDTEYMQCHYEVMLCAANSPCFGSEDCPCLTKTTMKHEIITPAEYLALL